MLFTQAFCAPLTRAREGERCSLLGRGDTVGSAIDLEKGLAARFRAIRTVVVHKRERERWRWKIRLFRERERANSTPLRATILYRRRRAERRWLRDTKRLANPGETQISENGSRCGKHAIISSGGASSLCSTSATLPYQSTALFAYDVGMRFFPLYRLFITVLSYQPPAGAYAVPDKN